MPGNLTNALREEFARGFFIGVDPSEPLLWFSSDARQVYVGFLALAKLDADGDILELGSPVKPTWTVTYWDAKVSQELTLVAPPGGANALVLASSTVSNPSSSQLLVLAVERLPADIGGNANVVFPAGSVVFEDLKDMEPGLRELLSPLGVSGAAPHVSTNGVCYGQPGNQMVRYMAEFDLVTYSEDIIQYLVGSATFQHLGQGLVSNTVDVRIVNNTGRDWPVSSSASIAVFRSDKSGSVMPLTAGWYGTPPLSRGQAAIYRPGKLRLRVT